MMDSVLLTCPLCCKQNFESNKSLLGHLSSYVWDYLCCPTCGESYLGVQELWFHLQKHILSEENGIFQFQESLIDRSVIAPSNENSCDGNRDKNSVSWEGMSEIPYQTHAKSTDIALAGGASESVHLEPNILQISDSKSNEQSNMLAGSQYDSSTCFYNSYYVCGACDQQMPTLDELKGHALKQHGITNIMLPENACPVEGSCLQLEPYVKLQQKTVSSEHGVCEESVLPVNNLTNVQKSLKAEKTNTISKFCCNECGAYFPTLKVLTAHTQRLHLKVKTCLCEDCGLSFYDIYGLKTHMRLHRDEKPFSCHVCKKRFVWAADLRRHEGTHTGKMTHICEVCGKGYLNGHQLNVHIRSHTGDRPYSCSVCGASFKSRSNLRSHSSIHEPSLDKSFPCDYCLKKFSTKLKLYHHRRMHIKSFKCKDCGRGFTCSRDVQQHSRTHTKDYKCRFCDLEFTQATKLLKHESFHKEDLVKRKGVARL